MDQIEQITMADIVKIRQSFSKKYRIDLTTVFPEKFHLPSLWKTYKSYTWEQIEEFKSQVYENLNNIDESCKKFGILTIDDYIEEFQELKQTLFDCGITSTDFAGDYSSDFILLNHFFYTTIESVFKVSTKDQQIRLLFIQLHADIKWYDRNYLNKIRKEIIEGKNKIEHFKVK